jgi:hypothetical protein
MTHRTDGVERVVLAQAGGLDTAIAIPWLADTYRAEIIAVTIDLGQRKEWLEEVRDRALATGALRAHVVDVRDEFARDYLVRGLKAGLFSDDPAAMTEALARPIIAQTLVSIAGIEEARAVAHGDRGGSGGAALGKAVRALDPALTVLAVPASMSIPRDERAELSRVAPALPDEPAFVEIALQRGVPTGSTASRCRGSTWWTASTSLRVPTAWGRPRSSRSTWRIARSNGRRSRTTPSSSGAGWRTSTSGSFTTVRGSRQCATRSTPMSTRSRSVSAASCG